MTCNIARSRQPAWEGWGWAQKPAYKTAAQKKRRPSDLTFSQPRFRWLSRSSRIFSCAGSDVLKKGACPLCEAI